MVLYQVGALAAIAAAEGVRAAARQGARRALQHGGEGSWPCRGDCPRGPRRSIPRLSCSDCPDPRCCGPASAAGLRVAAEGFADRAYEPDGSLTPRRRPDAVIHDPGSVVDAAVGWRARAWSSRPTGRRSRCA